MEAAPLATPALRKVFALAAGQAVWGVGPQGYVEQHRGGKWSAVDCGIFANLNAAWASTADDVWLFGESGAIAHWDGKRCAPVHSGTEADLQSAWGSGSRDIWAAGTDRTVLHFDGVHWAATKLAAPAIHDELRKVQIFGTGPSDVWVMGEVVSAAKLSASPLWRWDGATWQLVPVTVDRPKGSGKSWLEGLPVEFTSLWASGPGDIWLAGIVLPTLERGSAVILRGGPSHWREMSMPSQDDEVSHRYMTVLGSGPKDAWRIVGGGNEGDCSTYWACEHWDGKVWQDGMCPISEGQDTYSWAAANDVWSVDKEGAVQHWDGREWQQNRQPLDFKAAALIAKGPHALFLLGTQETEAGEPADSVLLRWEGHAWSRAAPIVNRRLEALWGSGEELWAVGEMGEIEHYDGQDWNGITHDDEHNLHGVWGSSPTDLWAVGDAGTILHFRGKSWVAEVHDGGTQNLRAVWGSGPLDVWAAGDAGTLLHFDGSRFQRVATKTTNGLLTIEGSGADDVWVGGHSGTLLHFTGAGMQVLEILGPPPLVPALNPAADRVAREPVRSDILALKRRGRKELWVATRGSTSAGGTQNPTLWRWDGASWSPVVSTDGPRPSPTMTKLATVGTDELWAIGPDAALYSYRPTALLSP